MAPLCSEGICDGSGMVETLYSVETKALVKSKNCPCVQKAQERVKYQALMEASNVHMYSGLRLENFTPDNQTHVDALRVISDGPDGFYVFGPPGVGKTHLLAGTVFREIGQGRPAAIISVPALTQEFRETRTRSHLEELAYTIPYLVLDDIDKVNFTPMIEEMMFRLIDARWLLYRKRKGFTSFTSQIPRDKVDDETPWLGQVLNYAIQDRIRGLTINMFLDGESRRARG